MSGSCSAHRDESDLSRRALGPGSGEIYEMGGVFGEPDQPPISRVSVEPLAVYSATGSRFLESTPASFLGPFSILAADSFGKARCMGLLKIHSAYSRAEATNCTAASSFANLCCRVDWTRRGSKILFNAIDGLPFNN